LDFVCLDELGQANRLLLRFKWGYPCPVDVCYGFGEKQKDSIGINFNMLIQEETGRLDKIKKLERAKMNIERKLEEERKQYDEKCPTLDRKRLPVVIEEPGHESARTSVNSGIVYPPRASLSSGMAIPHRASLSSGMAIPHRASLSSEMAISAPIANISAARQSIQLPAPVATKKRSLFSRLCCCCCGKK